MSRPKISIFYGWIIVAASCGILFLQNGSQFTFGVFLTELCHDLGWTRTMVSGAYSLCFLWHGVTYLVTGRLNDKRGPRFTLAVFAIVISVGYALMSIVNAPWQLYVFYGIIIGTGLGFGYLPVVSTVSRWFVKKRGIALGITIAGTGIGALVFAPFAQFLIIKFGWRTSYLILAILLVAIALPISRLMRLNPSEKGLSPYGIEETTMGNGQHNNFSSSEVSFSFNQAFRMRQFWLLAAMYASLIFVVQTVAIHLKVYAVDSGIAEMTAATILGIVGGGSILGKIAVSSISDKIGRKVCFIICFLLMAVMMLWLMKARQPWQFYFFSALFGFSYGGCGPLFPAVSADWFGTRFHGSIFGALSTANCIGGAIGPLLAGYIFDTRGSYKPAFIIAAAVLFMAMGLSLIIRAPDVKVT